MKISRQFYRTVEENGLVSKHNKAKWSVYLPHDIALLNPIILSHIQWLYLLLCCTHRKSVISQKKINCCTVGVSTATRGAKFPVLFSCKAKDMLWCFHLLLSGLLDRSRYAPGRSWNWPVISTHVGFLCFSSVCKQILRWFPRCQVATACFSRIFSIESHRINARICNGCQILFF